MDPLNGLVTPLNAMAPLGALFFLTFLGRSVKMEVVNREMVYELKMGESMDMRSRRDGLLDMLVNFSLKK